MYKWIRGFRLIFKNELEVMLYYFSFNLRYSFEIKVPLLLIDYSRNIVV